MKAKAQLSRILSPYRSKAEEAWAGVSFFVMGQAVPKQSFRKTKNGGYTDPRVKAWQDAVGWKAKETMGALPVIFDTPLRVELEFHLKDFRVVDLDNLSKSVLDGMKGIVYADDKDVYSLNITKIVPSKKPHVFISVSLLDQDMV